MKVATKLWIALAVLIVISPVGLILPDHYKAGSAWGEWGSEEIKGLVGYVPKGLEKLSSLWNAPVPDYAFKGWEQKGLSRLSLAYIISAAAGVGIIAGITLLIGKLLAKRTDGNGGE
jgi:cobalt/nickel transport protein